MAGKVSEMAHGNFRLFVKKKRSRCQKENINRLRTIQFRRSTAIPPNAGFSTVLCCAVACYAGLGCAVLCGGVLCCTVLCWAAGGCAGLGRAVLFCTALACTLLHVDRRMFSIFIVLSSLYI